MGGGGGGGGGGADPLHLATRQNFYDVTVNERNNGHYVTIPHSSSMVRHFEVYIISVFWSLLISYNLF